MPHSLEVPAWLAHRASHDDPPTVLDDDLLARLERAGVESFVPVLGRELIDDERGAHATGVGVWGPGIGFLEPFEAEATRVAAALDRLVTFLEQFDKLRRLTLAAIDMRLVEKAARAMLDGQVPAPLLRVVETGLIITYARPYLDSNRAGGVGGRWRPESGADRAFHQHVIDELRDAYHAHADRTAHRTILDAAEFLELEAPPAYAESWRRLSSTDLETLADLAGRQAARFEAGAAEAGRELGAEA